MPTYNEQAAPERKTVEAAQFHAGQQADELLTVARRHNSEARIIEVSEWSVLLVETRIHDDRDPDWDVVQDGHWLVYSPALDVLYTLDDGAFRESYETS